MKMSNNKVSSLFFQWSQLSRSFLTMFSLKNTVSNYSFFLTTYTLITLENGKKYLGIFKNHSNLVKW